MLSRRTLLAAAPVALCLGCASAAAKNGPRLRSRVAGAGPALPAGLHSLGSRKQRAPRLYIPQTAGPLPLLVYLHGAGGSERQGIDKLQEFASGRGFALLSPASLGRTWDAIRDGYGPDVRALDEALAQTFSACHVDARRIGVCGFSDGASYALGLGLANTDLFGSAMAFSPGFIPELPAKPSGKARLYISHGTHDEILPIETCSRRIVPELKQQGHAVTYREFAGPHATPREVLEEAVSWFLS